MNRHFYFLSNQIEINPKIFSQIKLKTYSICTFENRKSTRTICCLYCFHVTHTKKTYRLKQFHFLFHFWDADINSRELKSQHFVFLMKIKKKHIHLSQPLCFPDKTAIVSRMTCCFDIKIYIRVLLFEFIVSSCYDSQRRLFVMLLLLLTTFYFSSRKKKIVYFVCEHFSNVLFLLFFSSSLGTVDVNVCSLCCR